MNRRISRIWASVVALSTLTVTGLTLQPAGAAGGTDDAGLQRPPDVRELVFLSSGHGMAYGPAAEAASRPAAWNPSRMSS